MASTHQHIGRDVLKNSDTESSPADWFVYIIRASDGRLYTGITTDVDRRFSEHSSTGKGARFFRGRQPEAVVYTEIQPDRSHALRREAEIKKLSRMEKLNLAGQRSD